jgi:hypothetical protein
LQEGKRELKGSAVAKSRPASSAQRRGGFSSIPGIYPHLSEVDFNLNDFITSISISSFHFHFHFISSHTKSEDSMATKTQELLTLEGAKIAVEAAEKKAKEIGVDMNIAVVDTSTHLLHFSRMEGAKITSITSMFLHFNIL